MMDERDYALGDMDRRMGNLLRFGTVSEVDTAKALARIDLGDLVTDWLPWASFSAGHDRTWKAPDLGEQVALLSPGDPSQGVIIGSIFQDAHPANGNSQDVTRTTFKDGTVIEYDRATHALLVDASGSNGSVTVNVGSGPVTVNCASATVNATSSVTLNTPDTHCTGNLQVDGNTTVNGTTLSKGKITGQAGMAISGGSGATVAGNVAVTGGNVTADGVSLKTHVHSGVQAGGSNTGVPV